LFLTYQNDLKPIKMKLILATGLFLFSTLNLSIAQGNAREMSPTYNDFKIFVLDKEKPIRGFGGLSFSFGPIDGKDAMIVGTTGGVVLNQNLAIGIGIHEFGSRKGGHMYFNYKQKPGAYMVKGGYAVVVIEPKIGAGFPIHMSFPLQIGLAGASYLTADILAHHSTTLDRKLERSFSIALEPKMEMEINMFPFMRVTSGMGYRYIPHLTYYDGKEDVFSGFSWSVTIKFGKF
jgi:hypothetical protein